MNNQRVKRLEAIGDKMNVRRVVNLRAAVSLSEGLLWSGLIKSLLQIYRLVWNKRRLIMN